jgi:molecular chaperone DnaK (HSP70)
LSFEFLIGIDLGTTNSAVAFVRARQAEARGSEAVRASGRGTQSRGGRVELFPIAQLIEASVVDRRPVLPSFLYVGEQHEIDSGVLALPWNTKPDAVAGVLARDRGALAPSRLVTSAKSWLAHPAVDRRAAILPWGAESGPHISPVEASSRYLAHMRDSWNVAMAAEHPERRFERQQIVLAVPASFDEEARELTVEAARQAQLEHLTLLEEPIAAFYAWAVGPAAGSRSSDVFPPHGDRVVLVCDVGGGTTDFSLIRVRTAGGTPEFERIAVGDHLLLGGDNVDLALATIIERRMVEARPELRLAITQRSALRRLCSDAKERMLGDSPPDRVAITVLGAGRSVVGAALTADLTRSDVHQTLDEFLPITAASDAAAPRDRRAGLRELGLPYETDPAITRHLSGFLARSAEASHGARSAELPAHVDAGGRAMIRPDLVLFNGGFFTPSAARERVVEALARWFGSAPGVLKPKNLEAAVAVGAATYARLRAGLGPAMSLVKAGSGRGYYIGLRGPRGDEAMPAVCVLARGTEEGSSTRLDHPFTVITNPPIAF